MNTLYAIGRDSLKRWWHSDTFTLGAATAFYMLLSLAPLLLIIIYIFGLFIGRENVEFRILFDITRVAGPQAAEFARNLVDQSYSFNGSLLATIVAIVAVIIGSIAGFSELQTALDIIHGEPIEASVTSYIRGKLFSFLLLLGLGIVLSISFVVGSLVPDYQSLGSIVSIILALAVFTFIFSYLPSRAVSLLSGLIGSMVTVGLFLVGRYLIAWYIRFAIVSAYGAAGTVIAILLWVYYSSHIIFLGAAVSATVDHYKK